MRASHCTATAADAMCTDCLYDRDKMTECHIPRPPFLQPRSRYLQSQTHPLSAAITCFISRVERRSTRASDAPSPVRVDLRPGYRATTVPCPRGAFGRSGHTSTTVYPEQGQLGDSVCSPRVVVCGSKAGGSSGGGRRARGRGGTGREERSWVQRGVAVGGEEERGEGGARRVQVSDALTSGRLPRPFSSWVDKMSCINTTMYCPSSGNR